MKKRIALILLSILIYCQGNSQNKKWAVEGSYGLNFNFFVPNYNENYAPTNHLYLYKKNVTGGARSIELKFKATPYASIFAGYLRTVNSKSYLTGFENANTSIKINRFNLKHICNFYLLGYERPFTKKQTALKYNIGAVYFRPQQQEISIDETTNKLYVDISERKFKNSKLEELGVFAGFSYQKTLSGKFDLGIKTRLFYLISDNNIETVSVTPILVYNF